MPTNPARGSLRPGQLHLPFGPVSLHHSTLSSSTFPISLLRSRHVIHRFPFIAQLTSSMFHISLHNCLTAHFQLLSICIFYLEGPGNLVSRLTSPITHIVTSPIPVLTYLPQPPDPPSTSTQPCPSSVFFIWRPSSGLLLRNLN